MAKPSIFFRITGQKRRQTLRKIYSKTDLPATTTNMVRKGKQVAQNESSDADFTPELKRVFVELEDVYQRTRVKKGVARTTNGWLEDPLMRKIDTLLLCLHFLLTLIKIQRLW